LMIFMFCSFFVHWIEFCFKVAALTRQLDTALTDSILRKEPQQQARFLKYLINTFLLLFNSRSTAKSISQPFLNNLMKWVTENQFINDFKCFLILFCFILFCFFTFQICFLILIYVIAIFKGTVTSPSEWIHRQFGWREKYCESTEYGDD
jgi:hypothetical protein